MVDLEHTDNKKSLDKSLNESKDTDTDDRDKTNNFMCTFGDFEEVDIKKSLINH